MSAGIPLSGASGSIFDPADSFKAMDNQGNTDNWPRSLQSCTSDPRALFATYPMASVTPIMQAGKHLSTLTQLAPIPTYMQPLRLPGFSQDPYPYSPSGFQRSSQDYVSHLSATNVPTSSPERTFWDANQQQATRLIAQQAAKSSGVPSGHTPPSYSSFNASPSVPTNYPVNPPITPFAQAVLTSETFVSRGFQNNHVPFPTLQSGQYPKPEESAAFFDHFLQTKTREINEAKKRESQAYKSSQSLSISHSEYTPQDAPSTSPLKRKATEDHVESSLIKRVHSINQMNWSPTKSDVVPVTPHKVPASAPIPTRHPNQTPYIHVPSASNGWVTPNIKVGLPSMDGKYHGQSSPSTFSVPVQKREAVGGYKIGESDEDAFSAAPYPPSTQSRGGDRDERSPLEKFKSYMEDIFEAEDSVPADPTPDSLDELSEFFSPLTVDWTRPSLNTRTISKLTAIIDQVARPTKRIRRDHAFHSPSAADREGTSGIDTQQLLRIIKMLERSVFMGEDVDPLAGPTVKLSESNSGGGEDTDNKFSSKNKKSKRAKTPDGRKSRSKSRTPVEPEDVDRREEIEVDHEKVDHDLQLAKEAIIAADACLALLASNQLPKQLYSEELITSCLGAVKNHLTKIIYPFLEANTDHQDSISKALLDIISSTAKSKIAVISEIFQCIQSTLSRIVKLVSRSEFTMSDSITIQAVFIAIGPFFVAEPVADKKGKGPGTVSIVGGTSALRGLRLSALSLIRGLFANHEDQRSWIIEEILTSLIRVPDLKHKSGQFRLRDNKSIHTVSALLFQLVQTSPHLLRYECQALAKQRKYEQASAQGSPFSEIDRNEIALYNKGLDSAQRIATTIVVFLTQRSGRTKVAKSTNETEYRAILDNMISDLLTVLYLPEWPGASLILGVIMRVFVASLKEEEKPGSVDNSAVRSAALDHLGVIAARLRSVSLRSNAVDLKFPTHLQPLDESLKALDISKVSQLIQAHEEIAIYLSNRLNDDQSVESAQELFGATWGHELAQALDKCDKLLAEMESNGEDALQRPTILEVVKKLRGAMQDIWKPTSSNDPFIIGSANDASRADELSERVGSLSKLNKGFDLGLQAILGSLDATAVFMRTKALRALGQILISDPSVLKRSDVRKAIEEHLQDNSPAVRDAAVELIGKYVLQLSDVAEDYYKQIADRIMDTGIGVRKRVIKLLKIFYASTDDVQRRIDISCRIVLRTMDEDDGVKDLAIKTLEELWFGSEAVMPKPSNEEDDRAQVIPVVRVIMGVVSEKDRQGYVGDFLHKVLIDRPPREEQWLHQQYARICDALIDSLVDGQAATGFTVVSCVKAVQIFVNIRPSIISSAKATTLLPYLKNAPTPEEQLVADNLLKIFRSCIPSMTKAATKFGQELQANLQPMIAKPSSAGGLQTIQEAIACFCVVINHLTHDFIKIIGLLRSCLDRLGSAVSAYQNDSTKGMLNRQVQLLVCMIALVTEHCNLDTLRQDHAELANDINRITKGSVNEHVYGTLVRLYGTLDDTTLRNRVLQCLGFLFRAYPTLMTHESSAELMDQIFALGDDEARGRLLKILQDFLNSESAKHAAQEKAASSTKRVTKGVDMDAFVGNTYGFAESGVSSAVVQRYLPQILDAALRQNIMIQNAAVDILGFTIKQGLAHPIQCLPVIIALETVDSPQLSGRANALHTILHSKHASLMLGQYVKCVQAAFQYQQSISGGKPVYGYRVYETRTAAVLEKWYSLVREKRATRMDFIRTVTKAFDVDSTKLFARQEDVDFIRFTVENFSAFEYKTQEEVLAVIRSATNVLSVAGMQLMEVLSPSDLMRSMGTASLTTTIEENDVAMQLAEPAGARGRPRVFEPFGMARASIILAMLLLLKSHLKTTYGLSEDKCAKWIPGKKSAIGDKTAAKKTDRPLIWDRLPFATTPIETVEDVGQQKLRFVQLWEEDPVIAEPEEEMLVLEA